MGGALALFGTPRELGTRDTVLRRFLARDDPGLPTFYQDLVSLNDLFRGRVHQAIRDLEWFGLSPEPAACVMAWAATLGTSFPDSLAEALVDPRNVPPGASARRVLCTGYWLAERRRTTKLDELIGRLRSRRDTAGGPAGPGARIEAAIAGLEGYRAWKRGEFERAAERASQSKEWFNIGAIWRGDLYRELGELERAEGRYLAAWMHPVAHERMGRLYEQMDEPEKAAAAYRRFVVAWEEADPELQGRVEAARERIAALTDGRGREGG